MKAAREEQLAFKRFCDERISDATRSIPALSQILQAGRQRGIRFVSIGELMEASSKTVG